MCQFFLFFFCIFFFLFFFLVLNFQVCIKSFLVFLFFNRTKCGKCAINTTKIYTPAPSFEKMFLLLRHDRLCRTCVLTGRPIQASQTGRTKHLGSVNGSSRVSQTKVFLSEEADVGTDSALSAKSDLSALLLETPHSKSER